MPASPLRGNYTKLAYAQSNLRLLGTCAAANSSKCDLGHQTWRSRKLQWHRLQSRWCFSPEADSPEKQEKCGLQQVSWREGMEQFFLRSEVFSSTLWWPSLAAAWLVSSMSFVASSWLLISMLREAIFGSPLRPSLSPLMEHGACLLDFAWLTCSGVLIIRAESYLLRVLCLICRLQANAICIECSMPIYFVPRPCFSSGEDGKPIILQKEPVKVEATACALLFGLQ